MAVRGRSPGLRCEWGRLPNRIQPPDRELLDCGGATDGIPFRCPALKCSGLEIGIGEQRLVGHRASGNEQTEERGATDHGFDFLGFLAGF